MTEKQIPPAPFGYKLQWFYDVEEKDDHKKVSVFKVCDAI